MARHVQEDPLEQARELSLAGLLGALGLLLPIGFHALGWGGKIFLPMHLPLVVAGFLLRPGLAIALGALVPFLSSVLTGMPPLMPPLALLMAAELSAKAGTASLLYRRLGLPMWGALPASLLVDWAVLAAAAWFAAGVFAIRATPLQYVGAAIAVSLPGTLVQAVAVPVAVAAVLRRVPRLRPLRREERV